MKRLILALIAGVFFVMLLLVTTRASMAIDDSVLRTVHQWSSPFLDRLTVFASTVIDVPEVLIAGLLLTVILSRRHKELVADRILLTVAGATVTTSLLKVLIHRPRPELWHWIVHESNWSFPSGHATASSAMAAIIFLSLWRTSLRWIALAAGTSIVLLIGFSRVYLGVHYPSDVIAGWCVGVIWALGTHHFLTAERLARFNRG